MDNFTKHSKKSIAMPVRCNTDKGLFSQRSRILQVFMFLLTCTYPFLVSAQQTISGKVTDAMYDETLVGVNIQIKGKMIGTVTDQEGNFTIDVHPEDNVLIFSYVGYLNEEISLNGRSYINVSLTPALETLSEMVVIGYGTVRKSDLTGSVASVKGEDIRRMPVTNTAEAIQGKAAGAYVSRTSGRPGAGSNVKIRGIGSINRIDPLWVVDGVKGAPVGNLDDIESIEILKDASAAAIYGAEAAGGVILVTTRRGSNKETKISMHSFYSSNTTMNFPTLLDANQYSKILLSTLTNDGIDTTGYNSYWNRDWPTSTDWVDVMFQTGFLHNHTISASGGTEQANYYLSGGYSDQKGTYYNSDYQSFNFKINSDIKVKEWLKVGESLTFVSSLSSPETSGSGIYRSVIRATPTIPVYDPTNIRGGGYGYIPDSLATSAQWAGGNPYAESNLVEQLNANKTLFANFYGELYPISGLTWRTNAVGRFNWNESEHFRNPTYHSTFTRQQYNTLDKNLYSGKYYMLNSFVTFSRQTGNHSYSAMQGFEASYSNSLAIATEGRDIPNPKVRNTQMGDPLFLKSTMSNGRGASYSYFGRLNYAFSEKYLFTGNYRLDASEKFGPNYSTGFFPSLSAGWRISQESFMQYQTIVDDLKVRLGWGILGIDNIPSYLFSPSYSQVGYTGFGTDAYSNLIPGRYISFFANQNIRWEEIKQWNFGIDFALMRSKLFGSIEYYDKVTSNMLVNINLPQSSGFGNARINNGEISNKGIDMILTWQHRVNEFSYSLSGNAAYNVNKVLNLRDPIGTSFFIHAGQSRTEEDFPLASFYGYVAEGIIRSQQELEELNMGSPDGVYQKPQTTLGDIRYQDLNGDGKITAEDQTFIGNPWPDWVFGFTMMAEWKSFDISMFWQGVYGIDIYNQNKIYTEALFSDYNSSTRILDAWSSENPNGEIPRISYNDPNQNFQNISSYFIEDGSYLRLKNIQLGYTLPKKATWIGFLSSARVYASGMNLITLTKYTGVDPEFVSNTGSNTSQMIDDTGNYPQYMSWVFGVQIDF